MLEVIQDVLAAEKRAGELVEQARRQAAEITSAVSEEETAKVRAAEAQAEQRVREAVAAASEDAERRVAQSEADCLEREKRFDPSADARFIDAVDQVVALLRSGPVARDDARADQRGV